MLESISMFIDDKKNISQKYRFLFFQRTSFYHKCYIFYLVPQFINIHVICDILFIFFIKILEIVLLCSSFTC